MNAPEHPEFVPLTEAEAAFARLQIALYRYRLRTAGKGLEEARRALYGHPPTPEELAEARSQIAAQQARDHGDVEGLF